MSQTINIWGATYSNVPGVELPKQGGGTALFSDASITTATESDVASGKQFLKADGSIGTGSASGGGGIVISDTTDVHGGTIRTITSTDQYTAKTSADLSASGATVTAPAGYYNSAASKSVASGSATAPASITGSSATVSTGTNTLTLSKTVSVTPTVSAGYVSSGTAGNSSVSLTASVNTRSSSDLTVSGDTVTAPAGYYASSASKSVASGTAGTPTASKGAVNNHSISVTPSVTNTTGYITGSTKTGTAVTVTASELASGNKPITSNGTGIDVVGYSTVSVDVPTGVDIPVFTVTWNNSWTAIQSVTCDKTFAECYDFYDAGTSGVVAINKDSFSEYPAGGTIAAAGDPDQRIVYTVYDGNYPRYDIIYNPNGTITYRQPSEYIVTPGTPTASKGTVSNHSVSVTPSVTNPMGYIVGGTITGTAVTVSASELVSGSETKTANGPYDVTNLASLVVNVSGGGSVSYDTKTSTASNYPTSLSFSSMKGEPKAFVCRLNASITSSGNTTYYYIVDVAAFGTTTHGNCFRVGSTRQVQTNTTGYSWSYSGTTLTITSSASSRSASPGAFYSGSYELLYCY